MIVKDSTISRPDELLAVLLNLDKYTKTPTAILAEADPEVVTALYDFIQKGKANTGIEVASPPPGQAVDKDFAAQAILGFLDSIDRSIANAHEDQWVTPEEKMKEATGYEDHRGMGRLAHRIIKKKDNRFPREDAEYVPVNTMTKMMGLARGGNVKSLYNKLVLSLIVDALLQNAQIPLDNGEKRHANEVFCFGSCQSNGAGYKTYFFDKQSQGYLRHQLENYQGFVTVSLLNHMLGRGAATLEIKELERFLTHLHDDGKKMKVKGGVFDPKTIIVPPGGFSGEMKARPDVILPYVRDHLVCGRTEAEKNWVSANEVRKKLHLSGEVINNTALGLVLMDMVNNRKSKSFLGIFREMEHHNGWRHKKRSIFLTNIGIDGSFYCDPAAIGTKITRAMVEKKKEEIKEMQEHQLMETARHETRETGRFIGRW